LTNGFQLAQVQCDNCGWISHPRERCFDLYPKLKLGCGGAAQKGCNGRGGGGGRGTPVIRAPPMATPPPTTEAIWLLGLSSWSRGLLPWQVSSINHI
jgi:hypothetical protein